ncbi:MAG: hypothetical protein E6J79_16570 [Deltaproteobacteria bacterium]|nr:MAG: hypothetical protein E6J79_16570 [Deltaproteobacteria bacterium]
MGGGCAAVSAAFELTRPEHDGRYAITIYQLGWRLGGKGASGRGPAHRVEEHGLHVWLGWYENAFRLLRECYAELDRDPRTCPIATWRDAFAPAPFVGVTDRTPDGRWIPWNHLMPPTEGFPGDPPGAGQRMGIRDYMVRTVMLVRTLLRGWSARLARGGGARGRAEGAAARRGPRGGRRDPPLRGARDAGGADPRSGAPRGDHGITPALSRERRAPLSRRDREQRPRLTRRPSRGRPRAPSCLARDRPHPRHPARRDPFRHHHGSARLRYD